MKRFPNRPSKKTLTKKTLSLTCVIFEKDRRGKTGREKRVSLN
jgi:hypothetical protein